MFEWGDYAANAIQIQNAKHFRELLGNYSRWGFHHPGPAFFYLFAAGEAVFHDCFHLVPEAMNAYALTIVLTNSLFLFLSIWIVARQVATAFFVPAAVIASLLLVGVINRTISSTPATAEVAFSAVWMPHVLLFCFLFFLICCAAVACGQIRLLPLAAFSGLMLLHAHVAQGLFVGPLSLMMVGVLLWRQLRTRRLSTFLKDCRSELIICCVLACIFATPIVADVALHHPNNLDAIRTYLRDQVRLPNSLRQAGLYELSFFTFLPNPEIVLLHPSPELFVRGGAHLYVLKYWAFLVFLVGTVTGLRLRGKLHLTPFVQYILLEVGVVTLLFLYWTLNMAGGLFNFNGYFFYSIQFAIIFCLLSVIATALPGLKNGSRPLAFGLSCAAPFFILASQNHFTTPLGVGNEINQISLAVEGRVPLLQIVFPAEDWPTAVGVASRFKRANQQFCVASANIFFGSGSECKNIVGTSRLILTHKAPVCTQPCQVVWHDQGLTAEISPYPILEVPFTLASDQVSGLFEGFYIGPPDEPMWTSAQSSIRFLVAPGGFPAKWLRITVVGETIPGRPVEVRLNGNLLGSLTYGQQRPAEFVVPGDWLKRGSENSFALSVPGAGPAGEDVRHLGFRLERISVAAADPQG